MIYLSLDMSSKKSGYSLFNDKELLDFNVWEMSFEDEKDWRERIRYMANKLNEYIKGHNVEFVYCEDVPPVLDNSQTVKILSALQGCVISICNINNIPIEFVSLGWKNDIGINLTHSKQYKDFQKKCKVECPELLSKFKSAVKAVEKKMSVEYANKTYGLDLIWKSPTSKYNQDDIADSINIATSRIEADVKRYDINTFENILDEILQNLVVKSL